MHNAQALSASLLLLSLTHKDELAIALAPMYCSLTTANATCNLYLTPACGSRLLPIEALFCILQIDAR